MSPFYMKIAWWNDYSENFTEKYFLHTELNSSHFNSLCYSHFTLYSMLTKGTNVLWSKTHQKVHIQWKQEFRTLKFCPNRDIGYVLHLKSMRKRSFKIQPKSLLVTYLTLISVSSPKALLLACHIVLPLLIQCLEASLFWKSFTIILFVDRT